MVTLEQLRVLGKEVMSSSVDAELSGLTAVCSYLSMAFDEIVRVAVELNKEAGAVEVEEPSVLRGEFESGG